ncbi:winged helix-turn-helix domain-containing protein [Nocardia sp. NBC_01327]|uniref:winged helix-turn-helix domain-containing protein n=1 Tax=Nocardia sp. NBC_01327 TaxID=2903593 RepID=UPI002E11C90D|nr:winged helix DNA-binding protein [Nocardia sp. NBC_01327]
MTPAEIAVLTALRPNLPLNSTQIQQAARLTAARTRNALSQLESRGLIMSSRPRGRYRITPRGRAALITKSR